MFVYVCVWFLCRIYIPDFSRQIDTFSPSLSRLFNTTHKSIKRESYQKQHAQTKRERESVLKRRNTTTTTSMGWLKRAASSVKSALGFGDDDDGEDDDGGDGYRDCDDGSSSRRRSGSKSSSSSSSKKKEQQQKVRYPVLQFAQSPITGEFIGGVQGLSWFCESLRENGEGDVAHEFRREDEETAGKEPSRRVKSGTFFPMRVKDGNVEMFRRNS